MWMLLPLRSLARVALTALLPVITLLGLSLPALISGAVFVEVIFAWPGMGREMVGANDEVDVHRPDDDDSPAHRMPSRDALRTGAVSR